MLKTIIAPGRYVQGPGALAEAGRLLAPLGRRAVALVDPQVRERVMPALGQAVAGSGVEITEERFGGECSRAEIDRLADRVGEGADLVIGIGGGKTLDTAKAAAYRHHCRLAVIPTIASTDAPTSALSVVYTERGEVEELVFFDRNPDLVLVDTAVIVEAPIRFLVAGMGDALATRFEAEAVGRSRAKTTAGGRAPRAALALARLCYDTLLEYGPAALASARRRALTEAFERVVEANTYLSGLGFESGGLAAAHAIHNGLSELPATHGAMHGEKVAIGTLAQLMLEDRSPDDIAEVMDFCLSVGLPVTLADIGVLDATDDELRRVADRACAPDETIHNEWFPVTPADVIAALRGADALGREAREQREAAEEVLAAA